MAGSALASSVVVGLFDGSSAAADQPSVPGFSVKVLATGHGHQLFGPDDLTMLGARLFVAWQNGIGPLGQPGPTTGNSTVIEYTRSGHQVASWSIEGHCDGLGADLAHDRIVATVNEDGNSSLYTISPDQPLGHQLVHYAYSEDPLPSGGGTDSVAFWHHTMLISASSPNPAPAEVPAVYSVHLRNGIAEVAPFFSDMGTAVVLNKDSSDAGRLVTLGLTDPDSSEVVPDGFGQLSGDFVLDSQGDEEQIYVAPGAAGEPPQLSVLDLTQSINDSAFVTGQSGTLYATEHTAGGSGEVVAITGPFVAGTVFVAATPTGADVPAPNAGPNYLATLDLGTGQVTSVGGSLVPEGLLFVPTVTLRHRELG
jgi:hypothetical protein